MSAFKRSASLLLALAITLGTLPGFTVRAAEAPAAVGPAVSTDVRPENNFCQVHGILSSAVSPADALSAVPVTAEVHRDAMNYANSDVEAYTADWCYLVGSEDGLLYREGYDLSGRRALTSGPVSQIAALDGSLYALVRENDAFCIQRAAESTLQWERLCLSDSPILRFAVTPDALFYLTAGILFRLGPEGEAEKVLEADGLCRFWLASDSVAEYIASDETVIFQYDLSTGETFRRDNPISLLDESLAAGPESRGLNLGSLRSKFPHGKYWNHAGNPGSSNSVNNQDGYTGTPCPVHGVVGTSQQTCNGFQPGSIQLSWQCMGYAEKLGYDATGYNPRNNANGWYTNSSTAALDTLKAGDIVRYKNNNHSIYITGVNGDTVTYTDCNNDGHCIIRWDATVSKSTLRSTFSYVRTAPGSPDPAPVTCGCSTAYAGTYTCATSSTSLNMRSGHGTGYSIITSIPSGATVYVSMASGSGSGDWAHVEYNGYSGYASMQYLAKQADAVSRSTTIDLWMSDSEMGSSVSSVRTGEWLYLCYQIYDKNTGDLFDSYNTAGYTATLTLYGPGGDVEHSQTYSTDSNWISIKRATPGIYRGEITFTFASGGTTTAERAATMIYDPQVTPSASAVQLDLPDSGTETLSVSYSGATASDSVYVNATAAGDCFTYAWGTWSDHVIPLTITGTRAGSGSLTIGLYDSDTHEHLASAVISVRITAPTYSITYSANGGTGAPAGQTKAYGVPLILSDAVPTRTGYTFLGWATSAAGSAVYQPGGSFNVNTDATLYAVWKFDCENGHSYVSGTCTRCGAKDPDYVVIASGWSGDLTWELSQEGILTFFGPGSMRNYTYKSEMPWYGYFDRITRVVLNEGVTSIGSYAFYGMPCLESIEIPGTVTTIGDYAFKNAAALKDVVLPAGLTRLGESAFYGCSALSAIEIPASLWTVQPYTFKNCTALAAVTFHEGNLQKISDGAFYNTALTEVVLPDCLDILDVYVFKNCASLANVTLGSGLTQIREAVLYGTAISAIEIPAGVTVIKPYAFKNCTRLASVDLPATLTAVEEAAFYACTALESVALPDAVTKIGNYAFRRCTGLREITFGAALDTIGECSFYGCTGLTALEIPDSITAIGAYAFKGCTGLTAAELGSRVAVLGESAFHTCTGLRTLTIPGSVETIGDYCFSGSWNLWQLTFLGDAPAIGAGAFKGLAATAFYPAGNATWTSGVRQNYGGTITWTAR